MNQPLKISVLDLCPILSGKSPGASLQYALDLAQFAEGLGLHRFWVAEHHNMLGIGSSAPEVLIAHLASGTKKIRVGSGGIMLPNHSAYHMAEVFRTLHALYPGRIDLGLGRAPGSGSKATRALRKERGLDHEQFPEQFHNLMSWLQDSPVNAHPDVHAVPTNVPAPEVWLLGSSDFGASMAAHEGVPYAFAQHFSHLPALEILRHYRENFRPSPQISQPQAMLATHIICAETDAEAQELARSHELSFSQFIMTGKSMPLPSLDEVNDFGYSEEDWKQIRAGSMPKFVGSPDTIRKKLSPVLDSGLVDELMVLTMVYDQEKRKRSYELLQEIISDY